MKIAIGAEIKQTANAMPTPRNLIDKFILTHRFTIYYS